MHQISHTDWFFNAVLSWILLVTCSLNAREIYGLGEPEAYIILEALIKNKIEDINTKLYAQVNAY